MLYNGIEEIKKKDNIRVYIRMRPLLRYEDDIFWIIDEENAIYTKNYFSSEDSIDNNSYELNKKKKITNFLYSPQKFRFDKIYSPKYESQIIYKEICQNIIKSSLDGFNGSILLYGQTTSGKTFTMLGTPNSPGILPCSLNDLFISINKKKYINNNILFNIYCSYLEIYNEKISDLLNNSSNLKLVEDKKYGIIVSGAKRVKIQNFEEGIAIKDYGEENRKYRDTLINEYSSRSHCIFQIYLEQFHLDEDGDISKSYLNCLNLVDLAGSERINKDDNKIKYIEETGYINKSLFMLTNVIKKLAENFSLNNKNNYIPYRDSILTRLLSQSLGGNSLTTLLCTISPAEMNYNQTLSTLRFASRAKCVKLEAKPNEYLNDKNKIYYYQKEIQKLKEQLRKSNDIVINNINVKEVTENVSQYEYNKIVKAYNCLNDELQNYKKLYLKEKKKSEKYKLKINNEEIGNSLDSSFNKENEIINSDNSFVEDSLNELVYQKEDDNKLQNGGINNKPLIRDDIDEYEQLKDFIINKGNNESMKKIKSYAFFKETKKNNQSKIENGEENKNYFYLNTNKNDIKSLELKDNINEIKKDKFYKNVHNQQNNTITNLNQNKKSKKQNNELYSDENQKIINSIKNGNVFEMLDLNYNEFVYEGNNKMKKIEMLNKIYEFKIDALEKTMEYYKSSLEEYYFKKLDSNENKDLYEIRKDYMLTEISNNYENLQYRLKSLYNNKREELEYNYQLFLSKLYKSE